MQVLSNRQAYGQELAGKIEALGSVAVSIANRWEMGWPSRVAALLKSGSYLEHLKAQTDQEKDILAEAGNLQHLSPREILQMYEIPEAPPAAD